MVRLSASGRRRCCRPVAEMGAFRAPGTAWTLQLRTDNLARCNCTLHWSPILDASAPLDWDDLRLVLAIAGTGGMAGAAERLGIDPSTVFRRLGRLEAALG